MQRLPGMRKERRRIKEKCDCTRPEDVVDWKKNKGVVGGIRDAIRPTTEEKAFLLALYEMTRLICINKYGADRSFSIERDRCTSGNLSQERKKRFQKKGRMEMKEYLEKSSKILDELQTTEQGLSEAEAARRLSEHGPNRLAAGKRRVIFSGFSKN